MCHKSKKNKGEKKFAKKRFVFCKHCGKVVDSVSNKRTKLPYDPERMGHVSKCHICQREDNLVYCQSCQNLFDRRDGKVIQNIKLSVTEKNTAKFNGKKIPVVNACGHCLETPKKTYKNLLEHFIASTIK